MSLPVFHGVCSQFESHFVQLASLLYINIQPWCFFSSLGVVECNGCYLIVCSSFFNEMPAQCT